MPQQVGILLPEHVHRPHAALPGWPRPLRNLHSKGRTELPEGKAVPEIQRVGAEVKKLLYYAPFKLALWE